MRLASRSLLRFSTSAQIKLVPIHLDSLQSKLSFLKNQLSLPMSQLLEKKCWNTIDNYKLWEKWK